MAVVSAEYSYYEKYSSESFSYKNNTKIFNDLIYNNDTKIGSKEESGLNNRLTLSGFEPGSLLKITMTALNSSGESPKSAPIDVQLKAIASLSVTIPNRSITSTSFKIQWEKQSTPQAIKY